MPYVFVYQKYAYKAVNITTIPIAPSKNRLSVLNNFGSISYDLSFLVFDFAFEKNMIDKNANKDESIKIESKPRFNKLKLKMFVPHITPEIAVIAAEIANPHPALM
jgi:hypothetical protein